MALISRDQFVGQLNGNWQAYIHRYQALSTDEQARFLQQQGYERFTDLLAHILAWWQDAVEIIQQMQQDPALPIPDYDVDAFNAQAVQRMNGVDEAAAIDMYEKQCLAMLQLVSSLPDPLLYQANINKRLYYEIIVHWSEHVLEASVIA